MTPAFTFLPIHHHDRVVAVVVAAGAVGDLLDAVQVAPEHVQRRERDPLREADARRIGQRPERVHDRLDAAMPLTCWSASACRLASVWLSPPKLR
jgi:hypothetical protein